MGHQHATAARIATGDEMRRQILRYLADGPATLAHIRQAVHIADSTARYHLHRLQAAGLVACDRPGQGQRPGPRWSLTHPIPTGDES